MRRSALLVTLLAILCSASMRGQNPDVYEEAPLDGGWLYFGAGIGTSGIGMNGGLAIQIDRSILGARCAVTTGLFGNTYLDIGLMIGRTWTLVGSNGKPPLIVAIASVGPAAMTGRRGGDLYSRGEDLGWNLGLAGDLQLLWRPLEWLGLGGSFFYDANAKQSFAGGGLLLQLGFLRTSFGRF